MRMLPFFKPKKGFMIAGGGLETSSGGGGGGGAGYNAIRTTESVRLLTTWNTVKTLALEAGYTYIVNMNMSWDVQQPNGMQVSTDNGNYVETYRLYYDEKSSRANFVLICKDNTTLYVRSRALAATNSTLETIIIKIPTTVESEG